MTFTDKGRSVHPPEGQERGNIETYSQSDTRTESHRDEQALRRRDSICPLTADGAVRHMGECSNNCPFQIKRRIERAKSASRVERGR